MIVRIIRAPHSICVETVVPIPYLHVGCSRPNRHPVGRLAAFASGFSSAYANRTASKIFRYPVRRVSRASQVVPDQVVEAEPVGFGFDRKVRDGPARLQEGAAAQASVGSSAERGRATPAHPCARGSGVNGSLQELVEKGCGPQIGRKSVARESSISDL